MNHIDSRLPPFFPLRRLSTGRSPPTQYRELPDGDWREAGLLQCEGRVSDDFKDEFSFHLEDTDHSSASGKKQSLSRNRSVTYKYQSWSRNSYSSPS